MRCCQCEYLQDDPALGDPHSWRPTHASLQLTTGTPACVSPWQPGAVHRIQYLCRLLGRFCGRVWLILQLVPFNRGLVTLHKLCRHLWLKHRHTPSERLENPCVCTRLSASHLKILSHFRAAPVPLHSQGGAASYCQNSPDPGDVAHLQPGGTHGSRLLLGLSLHLSRWDGAGHVSSREGLRHPLSNQRKWSWKWKKKKKNQATSGARLGSALTGT